MAGFWWLLEGTPWDSISTNRATAKTPSRHKPLGPGDPRRPGSPKTQPRSLPMITPQQGVHALRGLAWAGPLQPPQDRAAGGKAGPSRPAPGLLPPPSRLPCLSSGWDGPGLSWRTPPRVCVSLVLGMGTLVSTLVSDCWGRRGARVLRGAGRRAAGRWFGYLLFFLSHNRGAKGLRGWRSRSRLAGLAL